MSIITGSIIFHIQNILICNGQYWFINYYNKVYLNVLANVLLQNNDNSSIL